MKLIKRHTSRPLRPAALLSRPASCLLLLAILLLAAGLRFYRLDAQSFWNDEGNSARIAERTPDLILEGAEGDIHPPGYYLLLHYWRALFGQSEFALRSLSVWAGLATVVFTYLLGRRLLGEATGLLAAFLGAISPLAIYYSQEARMYAPLAALSAASTYLLFRLLTSSQSPIPNPQPRASRNAPAAILAAYILTAAAGLYTQYAFPFVLLVHNVTFGLWWLAGVRRPVIRWKPIALWAGAQAAILILYLPWLPIALNSVTGWSSAGRTYELGAGLLDVLRVLGVGITLPADDATVALAGMGLLLAAGLWPTLTIPGASEASPVEGTRRVSRAGWLGVGSVAVYLLLPIALIFAFDLYKPAWLKFLVVVLPPFHVLIGHGIETLTRLCILHSPFSILHSPFAVRNWQVAVRTLLAAFLAALTFPSLHNLYFDPAYARDDYRQLAADVAAFGCRDAAIILNAPNQWEVFTYYYPDQDVYPAPYRPDAEQVEEFLTPLVERHRRLFVLYWGDAESDPQRLVETWLAVHAYKADDRWYGRVRLSTYGVAPRPQEPAVALDAHFGEHIRLRGYALAGDWFAPGDLLPVTLLWEAQAPIAERYKVTVQLLDGTGQLVAQRDAEPGDGLSPTTTWKPGQVLKDRYGVLLPADVPPGRYTLIAGIYHVATGERLPVASGGEHVVLCHVEVKPPP